MTEHSESNPTVLFAGGGTAGPVTPLLAVAAEIRRLHPGWRCSWIGTATGPERQLVEAAGIPFEHIPAGKLRRYLSWRTLLAPFEVVCGLVQAWRIIGRQRPSVVVSAGGFVAVPVIWAARLRRVPVHVHQQDLRPTLTNVVTAPFASSFSVAFEKSAADFSRRNPVVTGNPVRPAVLSGSRERAREVFGLADGLPTVLVVGGGTGAAGLNSLVFGSLGVLTAEAQVIHLTGRGKSGGAEENGRYRQYEMLTDDMPHALAAADLVVTRAGLGTLSELAVLGKPTVIVPMPRSHQEDNAKYFSDQGAAVYLSEPELFSKKFGETVVGLLRDKERLAELSRGIRKLNDPGAAAKVAELVAGLVNH